MKRRMMKLVSLLCVTAMTMSLLAGCGGAEETSTDNTSAEESVETETEEEVEEESVFSSSVQEASAANEDVIITDKKRARSCFLRSLELVFI